MKEDLIYTDLKSECALLGSLILEPVAYFDIKNIIPESLYFSLTENQIIYDALCEIFDSGQLKTDLILIRDKLASLGRLDAVGGMDYIISLADTLPSAENAVYYAHIVRDKYKRRRLRDYGQAVVGQTMDSKSEIDVIYENATNDIQCVFDEQTDTSHCMLSDAADRFDMRESTNYISTGFEYHDDVYYGLGEGHVIVVAGRPGMGKTSLMLEMAVRQCRFDAPVAFFSLEMPTKDLVQRTLCSLAKVNLYSALKGSYSIEEEQRIESARASIREKCFVVDQTRNLTPSKLRSRLFTLKSQYGIKVAYVDYLQLMKPDKKGKGRYEDVTDISRDIKSIALQIGIPIVIGCQLNRMVEGRDDKRTRLSDLRDSGAIEQDADIVLMCHRPGYYNHELDKYDAEVIVTKNRRGRTQSIKMRFVPEFCCFEESVGGILGPTY